MADLYASIGGNAKKVTEDKHNLGTPQLTFLTVAGTLSASAVDLGSAAFLNAIAQGVQGFAEVYGVGEVDGSSPYDVVFMVNANTLNKWDTTTNANANFSRMEAAILAAVNGVTAATVDAVAVTETTGFTGNALA
jgi:hypothetical protein